MAAHETMMICWPKTQLNYHRRLSVVWLARPPPPHLTQRLIGLAKTALIKSPAIEKYDFRMFWPIKDSRDDHWRRDGILFLFLINILGLVAPLFPLDRDRYPILYIFRGIVLFRYPISNCLVPPHIIIILVCLFGAFEPVRALLSNNT